MHSYASVTHPCTYYASKRLIYASSCEYSTHVSPTNETTNKQQINTKVVIAIRSATSVRIQPKWPTRVDINKKSKSMCVQILVYIRFGRLFLLLIPCLVRLIPSWVPRAFVSAPQASASGPLAPRSRPSFGHQASLQHAVEPQPETQFMGIGRRQ